jgi:S-ribosylhomocysteine lyase
MERIASFEVNHLNLGKGIYISRVDDDIVTYDIRVRKPNTTFLDTGTIHTIEHLVATFVRNSMYKEKIIYFGPMGCRTGFYLLVRNMKQEDAIKLIYDAFSFVGSYTGEIPGTTLIECGNYLDHNLNGAREEAKEFVKIIGNYHADQLNYSR